MFHLLYLLLFGMVLECNDQINDVLLCDWDSTVQSNDPLVNPVLTLGLLLEECS